MNGKSTGVWYRHGSENDGLVVFMDGGGACFNLETCDTAAHDSHPGNPGSHGVFSAEDVRNPVQNYSWVWLPYCTGDVHIGQAKNRVAGAERIFDGHGNVQRAMERAVATWNPRTLVIGGQSAGGFGSVSSFASVRDHFPKARAVLIDDSGPVIDDKALAPCLQAKWREIWNLNASLPANCSCVGSKGNLVSIWSYLRETYPHDSFGLISSINDGVVSTFFSYGELDCKNTILPIGYTKLHAGLERLSDSGVSIYMIPGNTHVHTNSEFFTREVSGVNLYQWVAELVGPGPDPGTIKP